MDLDNPLSDSIYVNIDGDKIFAIAPHSLKTVKIKAGKHTFETIISQNRNKKMIQSGYFDSTTDGLLNVTKSAYVVWKDIYMKEEKEEYYDNLDEKIVEINGREYMGDIKLFDETAIFIPKEWDYGVNKPFPDQVNLGNQPFVIKRKIYYKEDFIREYNNG